MTRPWESSTRRRMQGGWVKSEELPRGPQGRALCRWCRLEVPARRRTFCSDWCVTEWRMRTDPGFLRQKLFERDRGICATCRVDTVAEMRRLKKSRGARRATLLAHWGLQRRSRSSLWDADHVLPVTEGGGECDLSNLRTLCLRCHREATLALRQRLARRPVIPPNA